MSSEWCVLWLSVKVTLHVNMLTMLRDLKKVLHGIRCHGHMAPVGLFHFEEMVNIVNMKGHRAGLTSVKLHVSMTRADVALGALAVDELLPAVLDSHLLTSYYVEHQPTT